MFNILAENGNLLLQENGDELLLDRNILSEMMAGFEAKNGRNTAFVKITNADYSCDAHIALATGVNERNVTSEEAKRLLGVTAGETITLYCELFIDSVEGSRTGRGEVSFYQEDGTPVGSTEYVEVSTASVWEQKKKEIVVPATATRCNVFLRAGCGAGETVQVWLSKLKLAR